MGLDKVDQKYKFVLYAAGVFTCYFYFGILQEKITKGKYTLNEVLDNGEVKEITERFTYVLALVCIMCLINYIFAKAMLTVWPQGEDKTPHVYRASAALTYILAMICSNMALMWVSYPTQVVGKAGKPIPVMVLGVLIGRKSYPLRKYLFIFLVVIGVVMFMYKDVPKANQANQGSGFGLGELLIVLSLAMDGLTGAVQERMRSEAAPSAQHMMLSMNFYATIFLAIGILATGEGLQFVQFVNRHPIVLYQLGALAVAGALGQLFIFLMVSEFGPLPCSIVTTTRKFFTVLGSVVLFGNVLNARQWIGAVIVFTGLFLDAYYSKSTPKKK